MLSSSSAFEHERKNCLSMDALVIECTRTRTLLWFGHGCSGTGSVFFLQRCGSVLVWLWSVVLLSPSPHLESVALSSFPSLPRTAACPPLVYQQRPPGKSNSVPTKAARDAQPPIPSSISEGLSTCARSDHAALSTCARSDHAALPVPRPPASSACDDPPGGNSSRGPTEYRTDFDKVKAGHIES